MALHSVGKLSRAYACSTNATRCISSIARHAAFPSWVSRSLSTSASSPPRRVRSIILVRHGESQGNVDESHYGETADWLIPLTQRGRRQARAAGREVHRILSEGCGQKADGRPGNVFFYVSPYLRTRQTLRGILMEVDRQQVIGIREEPRVSEQQFGNFQDVEQVRDAKAERSDYGRFYYRFPNGESGFDVYERISGFLSSVMRDCEQLEREGHDLDDTSICIVTHGLSLRLILMRWFQYSVHEFEESRNPDNGDVVILKRHIDNQTGRSWYELKDYAREKLHLPAYEEQSRFRIADDISLLDTDPWDEGEEE